MSKSKSLWLFFGAVLLLPTIAFGIVVWTQEKFRNLPVTGAADYRWNDYEFSDRSGVLVHPADWKGKILVAHFFFTHCPSVCPRVIDQLKTLRTATGDEVLILSLTVDPERDSSKRLNEYAQLRRIPEDGWQLLTGKKTDLYRFARKNLQLAVTDGDGGPEDFIHSDNLVLIDRSLKIRGYYTGTSDKETRRLIRDIAILENQR